MDGANTPRAAREESKGGGGRARKGSGWDDGLGSGTEEELSGGEGCGDNRDGGDNQSITRKVSIPGPVPDQRTVGEDSEEEKMKASLEWLNEVQKKAKENLEGQRKRRG